jgi:tetratricopeptide (TPR) repeat protein
METTLIRSRIPKNGKRRLFMVAAVLSAVLFLSVLYYLSAHGNPMDFLDKYQKRVFTFQERLLTQPRVILFYISLIFYPMPTRLSLVHDVQASTSLFDPPGTLLSIGVILFLALAALRFMKKWPLLSFCVIFFLLNHLIESSIFALELIFEHRNYIPSMLMFVPVAALVVRGLDCYTRKKPMQIVISVFITLIIIGFGHSTFMRNFVWTHNESLWLDALDKAPGVWRPYHGLGKYYSDRNQKEKALEMYNQGLTKRSIANKHDKAITYYNLGLEYFRRRDQEKSLEYYLKAVKLWPGFADAHHNIGIVLASRNEYGRAIRAFRNTLTLDKNYHFAHSNIGFVFIKQGRYEAAIKELQMALKQTPHNIPTQQRLGVAYMGLEKYHEALKYFRGVLRQNPRDVTTLLFSAQTYHLLGRNDAAQRILDKAVPLLSDERLKGLAEKAPSFGEITPDGDILFPLLAEAYARRADLYSEKRAFCTEHSEVGREEGRP